MSRIIPEPRVPKDKTFIEMQLKPRDYSKNGNKGPSTTSELNKIIKNSYRVTYLITVNIEPAKLAEFREDMQHNINNHYPNANLTEKGDGEIEIITSSQNELQDLKYCIDVFLG